MPCASTFGYKVWVLTDLTNPGVVWMEVYWTALWTRHDIKFMKMTYTEKWLVTQKELLTWDIFRLFTHNPLHFPKLPN